jgi:hypothetical protein
MEEELSWALPEEESYALDVKRLTPGDMVVGGRVQCRARSWGRRR